MIMFVDKVGVVLFANTHYMVAMKHWLLSTMITFIKHCTNSSDDGI